jgi:hypothetical protein
MKINGIDGLTVQDMQDEIANGGKFVIYQWCVSIVVMTFRRGTDIYFVRPGESSFVKSLPWTLISLVLGWWGLPWGLIYTPAALFNNISGGKDVTQEVMGFILSQTAGPVFDYAQEVTPSEEEQLKRLQTWGQ